MAFRILSIDGGGLRGIIPLQILKEIELRTGKPIIESFDLFAGTSTGGLIVAALTLKDSPLAIKPQYTLEEIEKMYLDYSHVIFPQAKIGLLNFFQKNIKILVQARFRQRGIYHTLQHFLGEKRLSDCIKPVFISAYDVSRNRPIFFKSRYINPSSSGYDSKKNIKLRDICLATSAGPTFLPSHYFEYSDESNSAYYPNCIDGGIFINNPSIGALVEVLKHKEDIVYQQHKELSTQDIFLLSLGTGNSTGDDTIPKKGKLNRGAIKWVIPPHLIDVMMYGSSQAVDYQMRELLPKGHYFRAEVSIPDKYSDMADSSSKTLAFWKKTVKEKFLSNPLLLNELQNFIDKAGL